MTGEMVVRAMLAQQVVDLPRLHAALLLRDTSPNVVGFISGGAPSYELISLGVEALLADIRREVDECEQDLRLEIGHRWWRTPNLADALGRLGDAYEGAAMALGSTEGAERAEARISAWQRRTRVLLGEAWAPYRLKWPSGDPVVCPLDAELVFGVKWACTGELMVHRSDETGIPNEIRCRAAVAHSWPAGPGVWLRLGAMLGATA